eukprot:752073-Hanusia_phi.AAC.11
MGWKSLGGGIPSGQIAAMIADEKFLYVGGDFVSLPRSFACICVRSNSCSSVSACNLRLLTCASRCSMAICRRETSLSGMAAAGAACRMRLVCGVAHGRGDERRFGGHGESFCVRRGEGGERKRGDVAGPDWPCAGIKSPATRRTASSTVPWRKGRAAPGALPQPRVAQLRGCGGLGVLPRHPEVLPCRHLGSAAGAGSLLPGLLPPPRRLLLVRTDQQRRPHGPEPRAGLLPLLGRVVVGPGAARRRRRGDPVPCDGVGRVRSAS